MPVFLHTGGICRPEQVTVLYTRFHMQQRPGKDGWHLWVCCHPLDEPGRVADFVAANMDLPLPDKQGLLAPPASR